MSNKSHSPVTEMLSGKYKIWLMVGLAIMLVADVAACVSLWVHGVGFGYWFIPFITAVLDLLYLLGVVLSNQRFKYAMSLFIVYIVLTISMCAVWMLSAFFMDGLVFDNVTIAVWSILHIAGIASAIITYLYAARRIRGGRTIQLVLAIAVSCVLVLGCGVYYGIGLINDGYFGQGTANRPLTYEYLDNGECAVTGLVEGNETTVVVPYEFNGKKVTKVSANVITENITSITLKCDAKAAVFTDYAEVKGVNNNVIINAEKSNIDAFKTALYSSAATRALGNNLQPSDLANDEVFITFEYDEKSFDLAKGVLIPTWYGKKGDIYRLSTVKDVPYAKASDVNSDADLYYSYNNTDKYIMSAPVSGGKKINGSVILDSCVNVPVRFRRVYRVFPGDSNDTKYETAKNFPFSEVDGTKLDYKLTVAENADSILSGFVRDGFTCDINYKTNGSATAMESTLGELLEDVGDDVTVMPNWTLVSPAVTLAPANGADVVYGNAFKLTTSITHPILDKLTVEYKWSEKNEDLDNVADALEMPKTNYVGAGKYDVEVTVSASDITSCKATKVASFTMNILPRPLTVAWSELANNVYNDEDYTVTATLGNTIAGDEVKLEDSTFTLHNAKTYDFSAVLGGDDADCYYIVEDDVDKSYTILPRPVDVTWDEVKRFEYDGEAHMPNAHAFDLHEAQLELTLVGQKIDAGEDYQGKAVVKNNGNYIIEDKSENYVTFTIYPKTVSAIWDETTLALIYRAAAQAPTATAEGVDDKIIELNVAGAKTDANIIDDVKTEQYIAVASSPDKNYVVSAATAEKEFTIDQRSVLINWGKTALTYSGDPQAPTATATGVGGASLVVNVDGKETDTNDKSGRTYTAVATLANKNYKIELNADRCGFTIDPYNVNITWTDTTTLTYSGDPQAPTAKATGVKNTNLELNVAGAQTNAGEDYTATASLVIADSNYILANSQTLFKINKKAIKVTWDPETLTFEYDGATHKPTPIVSGAIYEVAHMVSGDRVDAGNNYTATFTLNDANHVVDSGETCRFSIIPQQVSVVWGTKTVFTYNGSTQAPTASATDKQGKPVSIAVSGAKADAFSTYTAIAVLSPENSNYTLANIVQGYTIEKYALTIAWGTTTTFTYDGTEKKPTATVAGLGDDNLGLKVSGAVDAGTNYTATATITNSNYSITNPTCAFNIDPKPVAVDWANTTLTYNGQTQAPTATIVGVDGKTINLNVTGGKIAAGDYYTAVAQAPNTNYTLTVSTHSFVINRMTVRVDWGNDVLTYNGKSQYPTPTAKGVGGKDISIYITGSRKDVGSGTAVAATSETNYTLTNTEKLFAIVKKPVTITVKSFTIEYGAPQPTYTYSASGIVAGDDVTVTYKITKNNVAYTPDDNIPAGEYDIDVVISGDDEGNYAWTVVKGKLTVTAPVPEEPTTPGTVQED